MTKALADEALDAQLAFIDFYSSEIGNRYCRGFRQSQKYHDPDTSGEVLAGSISIVGDMATTYVIAKEMHEFALAASSTMPTFPLLESDPPSPIGFLWLEEPVPVTDRHGKTMMVKCYMWVTTDTVDMLIEDQNDRPIEKGIWVAEFGDALDKRDDYYDEEHMELWREQTRFRHGMLHDGGCPWGMDPVLRIEQEFPGFVDTGMRFLLTSWRMMQEPYIEDRAIMPSRHVLRRADRAMAKLPEREDCAVRVVQLRRSSEKREHHGGEPDKIEWSHRWIVRGHWRNQWYPSESRHAPKWIPPYVKGPEEAPLLEKDTVYLWNR